MRMQASTQTLPISARCSARDAGRRRFLDHLLVAALHRAVAFAEVDRVALAVGQHLDLDVARVLEEFLHVDHVVAERGLGFGLGRRDRRCAGAPSVCTTRMPRPPPPPAALMITG